MARWLFRYLLRRDVRRVLRGLPPEDREQLRRTPEHALVRYHRGFGMGLRNGFVRGRYPGLLWHCHRVVEDGSEPMSLDALSSVAVHELWQTLQTGA